MTAATDTVALHHVRGEQSEWPMAAEKIFEGWALGLDSSGYARSLQAGDRFLGHSQEYLDNSSGSAGDMNITRLTGHYRLQVTITSIALTDVGKIVYMSDNQTYTLTRSGNTPVGKVVRYVTTNTCLVEFATDAPGVIINSGHSRTALQLPTAAILKNFDLVNLRKNPFAGSLLETDFTHAPCLPDNRWIDATYAASAGGKTATEHMYLGVNAIGELICFTTTDNQAVEGQWACPIKVSGGVPWAFGVRIKQSLLTDAKCGYFVGLMLASKLTGDLIVDAGTLQTEGSLGFQVKEGDGDKIDFVFDETGQTQNEWSADLVTQVADTYNLLEMYYNGTIITLYVDGVAAGTAVSAAAIAGADFPAGKIFVPTLALKAAHADDFSVTVDLMYAMQSAA
jgi:hypothetical protein